jgi:hypothetical protein
LFDGKVAASLKVHQGFNDAHMKLEEANNAISSQINQITSEYPT